MKAILLKEHGMPNILQIAEVLKPVPKDVEVLVRIHAASINDWDWINLFPQVNPSLRIS